MPRIKKIFPYVAVALVTAALIYLTPLKWIDVIEPTIKDIDPAAFQAEFVKNPDNFIFIDVRSASAYNQEHAVGAINAPLYTLYNLHYGLPKKGKEIVLICNEGSASGVGYSYLQHYGFYNIERVTGGIENWIKEGLPTKTENPASK